MTEQDQINAQAELPGLPEVPERDKCAALELAERETAREWARAEQRNKAVALARSYHDRGAPTLRDAVLNELGFKP